MPQKNPSINHLNFNCIKQIDYIYPRVCTACKRSQKTSQRVIWNHCFVSTIGANSGRVYCSTKIERYILFVEFDPLNMISDKDDYSGADGMKMMYCVDLRSLYL